ncbi:MAG: glycosyltransferase family 4 protein [Acidimicrobiia bacterium]
MRIAVVNSFFPPRAGGSAHLSEALARLCAEQGHEVLVITADYGDAPLDERHGNLRIVRIPCFAPKSRLAFNYDIPITLSFRNRRRLHKLLNEFAPDVVHQHGQFFDLTWMSSTWARRNRVPIVLSVHTRLISPRPLHRLVLAAGDFSLVRFKVRRSHAWVVPVDNPTHTYVRRRYGIDESRIVDIPVGVEPDRFRDGDAKRVRKEWGLENRPILLSVGHVIPLRDRLALVEAMPQMLQSIPDLAVVVVGNVYDDRFIQRAKELGVDHALIVTGAVTKNLIPDFAAAADVESHDLQGLGFGTASLEMLAAGVPVVTDAPADSYPTTRLVDGEHVIRVRSQDPVDVADAFVRVLRDPGLRDRVGLQGQGLVRSTFSMEAVAEQFLSLYERAAAQE